MTSHLDWLCPCCHAVVVRVPQGKALFFPKCLMKKSKKPGKAKPLSRARSAAESAAPKPTACSAALRAVHVRSNHVPVVVTAAEPPERVRNDMRTSASRRWNRSFPDDKDRRRWTRHGRTLSLWTDEAVAEKTNDVLNEQGEPRERFANDPRRARRGIRGVLPSPRANPLPPLRWVGGSGAVSALEDGRSSKDRNQPVAESDGEMAARGCEG